MTSQAILANHNISLEIDAARSRMIVEQLSAGVRLVSPLPQVTILNSGVPEVLSTAGIAVENVIEHQAPPIKSIKIIQWGCDSRGCSLSFEWAIPSSSPYILWRWSIQNQRTTPVILQDALMLASANHAFLDQSARYAPFSGLSRGTSSGQYELTYPGEPATLAVYLPGWQSWSYGGWLMAEDRFPRSWLRPFTHPMLYDKAIDLPRSKGHFRSEMFAAMVDAKTNTGIAFGFLAQRQSFGRVELFIQGDKRGLSVRTDLDHLHLDPGESFSCDWACLLVGRDGLAVVDKLAAIAGELNQARISDEAPVGWCSWYDYGQLISEEIIDANVDAALALRDQTPLDTIQVDDGFQTQIGDWLTAGPNFTSGMKRVADRIMASDFKAGLWLAPFIGLEKSTTVKDHPDWILRNRFGLPTNTGFVWSQFGRAFDSSHPDFLDYLQQVISTATTDWGYKYLKLDFLYAGALPGKRHNTKLTRAQAFNYALQLIRETAGESVTLVGCGCPLGPGIGIFDSMRIGPDVAETWKPTMDPFTRFLEREPTLPAAVNAIRNTINRAHFHRRWWINDPDCVLVREDRSDLVLEEVQSLITAIGLSGGSVVISDRLESLSPERLDLFGMLIPPLTGSMQLVSPGDSHDHPITLLELEGVIGKWWLVACFNTVEQPHRFKLELDHILPLIGKVHVFYVWPQKYQEHNMLTPINIDVPGHQVALFAIRQKNEFPTWVGDNIHLSQGRIVEQWSLDDHEIHVRIYTHKVINAQIWLYIPGNILSASYNGTPISTERRNDGLVVIKLASIDEGELEIQWSEKNDDY